MQTYCENQGGNGSLLLDVEQLEKLWQMPLLSTSGKQSRRCEEHPVHASKGAQGHENGHHESQRSEHTVSKGHRHGQGTEHLRFVDHCEIGQVNQNIDARDQGHGYPNGTRKISAQR